MHRAQGLPTNRGLCVPQGAPAINTRARGLSQDSHARDLIAGKGGRHHSVLSQGRDARGAKSELRTGGHGDHHGLHPARGANRINRARLSAIQRDAHDRAVVPFGI